MKLRINNRLSVPLLLGLAVFLFWLVGYPQALNFQEQNQLFLFTWNYLAERVSIPGGFNDWLSEFLVQFYYLPWAGSLVLALLAVALQQLTLLIITGKNGESSWTSSVLSVLPAVLLVVVMGDENVLLSYGLAIISASGAFVLFKRLRWWCDIILVPVLYWLVGPMAVIYVVLRIIRNWRSEWWTLLWLIAAELLAYAFIVKEYPLTEVMLGINYYRIPLILLMPKTLWIVPLSIILLSLIGKKASLNRQKAGIENEKVSFKNEKVSHKQKKAGHNQKTSGSHRAGLSVAFSLILVAVIAAAGVWLNYPKDKYELIMQDYLIRNGRWDDIISRAEKYEVPTSFTSNAVNLALAMTRQLADRQFYFYQSGEDALIMPRSRNNMSNLPSAEAFYQLGMINSAKRYMYDIQESIINGRLSGRCMKRIAECFIINGQYQVARKYLDVLKHSLFYSRWANDAEQYLFNDAKVNAHPEWGRLRRLRYKEDMLYSYAEIDKMFGLLFVNNPENKMALDYFMGEMLLKGNMQDFMRYMSWVQQYGGYAQMPVGYQDAVRCIQNHGNVPGSAYASYAQKMMSQVKGGNQ